MASENIQGREKIGGDIDATGPALGSTTIDTATEQPVPKLEPPQLVDEYIIGEQPVSNTERQIVGLDVRLKSPDPHYLPPSVLALGHRSTASRIATPPLEDYPICTSRDASSRARR